MEFLEDFENSKGFWLLIIGALSYLGALLLRKSLFKNSSMFTLVSAIGALIAIGLSAWYLLDQPDYILNKKALIPVWLAAFCLGGIILGYLTYKSVEHKISLVGSSFFFTAVIGLAFCSLTFKDTVKIILPEGNYGKYYLMLTNNESDFFEINEYGLGYVNQNYFQYGFRPRVFQGGKVVSADVKKIGTGLWPVIGGNIHYLEFEVSKASSVSGVFRATAFRTPVDSLVSTGKINISALQLTGVK